MDAVVAPLFRIVPVEWAAPDPSEAEAILLTSANAARHGGAQLRRFTHLPCYAVGEPTAAAAREAGFREVNAGSADGAAMVEAAVRRGIRSLLHLCGREHIPLAHPAAKVERRIVYAAEPVKELPLAVLDALEGDAVALLHSPRAARLFASLADEAGLDRSGIAVAAISKAAADAAGTGWRRVAAIAEPRDSALLELAAKLCNSGGEMGTRS